MVTNFTMLQERMVQGKPVLFWLKGDIGEVWFWSRLIEVVKLNTLVYSINSSGSVTVSGATGLEWENSGAPGVTRASFADWRVEVAG